MLISFPDLHRLAVSTAPRRLSRPDLLATTKVKTLGNP
jgi:hypothetical protein